MDKKDNQYDVENTTNKRENQTDRFQDEDTLGWSDGSSKEGEEEEFEVDQDVYISSRDDDPKELRELEKSLDEMDDEELEECYNDLLVELDSYDLQYLFNSDDQIDRQTSIDILRDILYANRKRVELEYDEKDENFASSSSKQQQQLDNTSLKSSVSGKRSLKSSKSGSRVNTSSRQSTHYPTSRPSTPLSVDPYHLISTVLKGSATPPPFIKGISRPMSPLTLQPPEEEVEEEAPPPPPLYIIEDINAADRLLATWLRSGLGIMTIGVGMSSRLGYTQYSLFVSLMFFTFGVIASSIGVVRNRFVVTYLQLGYILPSYYTIVIVSFISLGLCGLCIWISISVGA